MVTGSFTEDASFPSTISEQIYNPGDRPLHGTVYSLAVVAKEVLILIQSSKVLTSSMADWADEGRVYATLIAVPDDACLTDSDTALFMALPTDFISVILLF